MYHTFNFLSMYTNCKHGIPVSLEMSYSVLFSRLLCSTRVFAR